MRSVCLAAAALAACSQVQPFFCEDHDQCLRGAGNGVCIEAYGACAFDDPSCEDFGRRYDDSAGRLAGRCVGLEDGVDVEPICEPEICGDGYTECFDSDPACPPGDEEISAIDLVDAGGQATVDLFAARDDFQPSCADDGGRDAFFELTLTARETVYLDTLGSDFRAVLVVREGFCRDGGAVLGCDAGDACDAAGHARFVRTLEAGTYCAIVDQLDYADAVIGGFQASLRLRRGPPDAPLLAGETSMGDTCAATDLTAASCGAAGGRDLVHALLLCPGPRALTADTCATAGGFSPLLVLRDGDFSAGHELACAPGCASEPPTGLTQTLAGPGIFWLSVDSPDAASCGPFTLTIE